MHECVLCGQACDCDGEDVWHDDYEDCQHECDPEEDDEEDAYIDHEERLEFTDDKLLEQLFGANNEAYQS